MKKPTTSVTNDKHRRRHRRVDLEAVEGEQDEDAGRAGGILLTIRQCR